jgi:hypothetical protein
MKTFLSRLLAQVVGLLPFPCASQCKCLFRWLPTNMQKELLEESREWRLERRKKRRAKSKKLRPPPEE